MQSAPLPDGISNFTGDCFTPRPQFHNQTTVEFSSHGSGDLQIYDSQNRHTGLLPSGDIELGIPGSTYETLGGNIFILVPATSTYKAILRSNVSSILTLKVKGYIGSNLEQEAAYVAAPAAGSTSTTAELDFSGFQGNMNIGVDANGDGVSDATITPTALFSSSSAPDIVPPDIIPPSFPAEIVLGATSTIAFNATDTDSGIASLTAT